MNENTLLPQTLQKAIIYFSNPDVCLQFVVGLRWPAGISCPYCNSSEHSFLSTRRIWKCKGCKKQFSVKVGTIFEDSPLGLDKWLAAIWMIANNKNGVSSYEVHRAIGVTQKTAWFMLHRIRHAMQTGMLQKLSGEVDADEPFVGGKAANMYKDKREVKIAGCGATGKAVVIGLLARHASVQAMVVPDTKKEMLQDQVKQRVTPGLAVYTNALPSYIERNPEHDHAVVDRTYGT